MRDRLSVLHITPHLGGGIGRVLLGYLAKVKNDDRFIHQVSCLDYANDDAVAAAAEIGITLTDKMHMHRQKLLSIIGEADIVLLHWINHPLIYDFIVREVLPPCRLIVWSHISGFYPPYVFTEKILSYPDLFVFTSPISYEVKDIHNLPNELRSKLRVVWSTGGVGHVKDVKCKRHEGFNVGYIGTVDYVKMHPNYLRMCANVRVPYVRFIVCGGTKEIELQKESARMGISDKFWFTGFVSDIAQYLEVFDVFGYPLAPYHYGTCDQVLAESMACGVVPVVLANPMEKYMVEDRVTGLVAVNEDEYCDAIEELYGNKKLRVFLSKNAKEYACEEFTLRRVELEWNKIFGEVIQIPKTVRKWDNCQPRITAKDVFLESLGLYGREFQVYCNATTIQDREMSAIRIQNMEPYPIWQARTKGSVHHYNYFFPEEPFLAEWSRLMRGY